MFLQLDLRRAISVRTWHRITATTFVPGAHTVAARHFIVDAIWAKRHFENHGLHTFFAQNQSTLRHVRLGTESLTASPAIDVQIMLTPLGELLHHLEEYFPLKIPVIDSENPFFFDVSTWHMMEEQFGDDVGLSVAYKDLAGNEYEYKTKLDILGSFGPMRIGSDPREKIAKSLESIDKSLKKNSVYRGATIGCNVGPVVSFYKWMLRVRSPLFRVVRHSGNRDRCEPVQRRETSGPYLRVST